MHELLEQDRGKTNPGFIQGWNRSCRAALLFMALLSTVPWGHDMEKDMDPGRPDSLAVSGDSLAGLIAQALRNNPAIKAAMHQVKSLHSSPAHTWYLEPPQVGVEFFQAPVSSFPNPIKDQMEIDYSLQQSFPFPGKIASRIEAEHRHAEMGESGLEARKRKIVRDVKMGYYGLYLVDRRLEFNRQNRVLMGRLIEAARRQYEVGLGRQADILRAQTELTRLKSDSIALAQSRKAMEGMLNATLNRKTTQAIIISDSLHAAEVDWPFDRLQPILEENHPELRAGESAVRMRKAEGAMARKEYWPDIMVSGSYKDMLEMPSGTHDGELRDYWSVMVSLNIPVALWSLPKYKAGVVRNKADLAQAEEEYADARNQVFARAQQALLKAQSGKELFRLSRTVLEPQAEQALESTLASYQGGKSEFMALLEAYRTSLMAKENTEMARMQLLSSQAELEEAIGLGLEETRMKLAEGAGK
jgi:outer membrane protein, heavy metal efflux system